MRPWELLRLAVLLAALQACASSASYRRCSEVPAERLTQLPPLLSETGLFSTIAPDVLATGVEPFAPRFELWSDGATKRGFVSLPEGTLVDTSDMDAWRFPEGTKLWKEFTRDGVRLETRLLQKIGPGDDDWAAVAYLWDADGRDAKMASAGAVDALGTTHDVPPASQCMGCHGGTISRVLGFSAMQLPFSAGDGAVSLESLSRERRLSQAPASPFDIPGSDEVQRALGYLHANCAHCHNQHRPEQSGPRCFDPRRDIDLSLRTDALANVEATPLYTTAVPKALVPGDPEASALYCRARGDLEAFQARMPPLATELLDPEVLPTIEALIRALPTKENQP